MRELARVFKVQKYHQIGQKTTQLHILCDLAFCEMARWLHLMQFTDSLFIKYKMGSLHKSLVFSVFLI